MKRILIITLLALVVTVSVAGCATDDQSDSTTAETPSAQADDNEQGEEPASDDGAEGDRPNNSAIAWLDTELTDVVSGETYRLSDFKGTPILLHSFAVW